MMVKALHITTNCYSVLMLLLFLYDKLNYIVDHSERLTRLQNKMELYLRIANRIT